MSKKALFLTTFILLLSLAGNTLAADLVWDNDKGAGDQRWDDANNWTIEGTTDNKVPDANDVAIIDDLYTDAANGPIIQIGIDAVCDTLAMGQSDPPSVEAVLTMTGGTLTTGDLLSIGDDESGDYRFDLSDGTVTIGDRFALGYARDSNATFNMEGGYLSTDGDLFLGVSSSGTSNPIVNINGGNVVIAEDIELAEYAGASGTININGGTIEVADNIYVGWEQTGPATFNMTGGTVTTGTVTGDWIYVGGDYATDCHLNLDGGTLIAPGISLYPDVSFNISGGTFIVDGDYINVANGWIWDPCEEDWNGTLTTPGVVTVYGSSNYGIIDDANYPDELGKRAILLIDYDITNPGKTTVTSSAVDADLAWKPQPSSGSSWQPPVITLKWSPGDNAVSHDVYLGTSFDDVDNGTGGTLKEKSLDANSYSPGESLTLDTTYYWRIDEVNASGLPEWKGLVWNFKVAPGEAVEPYPEDEATDVPLLTILNWKPGPEVYTHQLYFSTDFSEVNDRSISYASPAANSYNPGELEFDTTYYWAVDEVNDEADVNLWPGDVWQFTTASFVSVENFNSYDDIDKPLVYDEGDDTGVWQEGWTNDSRSELYIERDLAYDGNAVRFVYKNTISIGGGEFGSWVDADTADLQVGSDWTIGDAKALRLLFYGDEDNSTTVNDSMYIALHEGTKVESFYYPEVTDINKESWHEWHIDLEEAFPTINQENVTMITIGFGTYDGGPEGGDGTVYFDEIELWPRYCRSELFAADVDGDCVADIADLEIMSADWLIQDYNFIAENPAEANLVGWWKFDEGDPCKFTEDSSVYENDGNAIETTWVEGYTGEEDDWALRFDGDGVVYFDHVLCALREGNTPGTYPAELMQDTFTVACWTKLDSFEYFSSFITNGIDTGGDECGFFFYNYGWNFPADPDVKNFGLAIRTEAGMWYVETDPVYEKDLWYHVAATYDNVTNNACVYVNGLLAAGPTDVGGPIRWISADSGNYPENFVIGAWLDVGYQLHVNGIIDDVRYYNYAMNQGEITMLANPVPVGTDVYQPVPSFANIADPEPELSRKVNFVDFAVFADSWLKEQFWP